MSDPIKHSTPVGPDWLREIVWVLGLAPATPVVDVEQRQLFVSEIVLGLIGIAMVALWYVVLAVGLVVGLLKGMGPARGTVYTVERITAGAMRLCRRPYPRVSATAPLSERFPRMRGWYFDAPVADEPEVETVADEPEAESSRDVDADRSPLQRIRSWHVGLVVVVADLLLGPVFGIPDVVWLVILIVGSGLVGVSVGRWVLRLFEM